MPSVLRKIDSDSRHALERRDIELSRSGRERDMNASGSPTAAVLLNDGAAIGGAAGGVFAAEPAGAGQAVLIGASLEGAAVGVAGGAAIAELGFDIPTAPDGPIYRILKRAMDICGGLVAGVLFLPVMVLAVLLVKLSDGGPILFSQTRVGRGGKPFTCYKFRTMVANADAMKHAVLHMNHHHDQRSFKTKVDPRITPIGRWLRRSSIDEFPQLWNVLRGDMSLVGPRPPLPAEVALYTDRDLRRLEVKPGLTCVWQIMGRGDLPFEQQIALDLDYIEKRGLFFDLWLLLRTIPVLLTAKGAY